MFERQVPFYVAELMSLQVSFYVAELISLQVSFYVAELTALLEDELKVLAYTSIEELVEAPHSTARPSARNAPTDPRSAPSLCSQCPQPTQPTAAMLVSAAYGGFKV